MARAAALDLRLLVAELYEERGIFPRGLAHPITFAASKDSPGELLGRTPGLQDSLNPYRDFQQFGAVETGPFAYFRLMQSNQTVLLFPGGAKEALSRRSDYPLFWPEKEVDFVRTAAKFNATVLPLSSVGMADSVTVVAEPQELVRLPFIGDRFREFNVNVSAARYENEEDDMIGFPLALPKMPARNYFVFGKPFALSNVDPKDKRTCARIYREIKNEVRTGLDDVLRAREVDPFRETPRRLLYERFFSKKAPTFPVDELNKKNV